MNQCWHSKRKDKISAVTSTFCGVKYLRCSTKGQEQLPLREAITGSNEGIELQSAETIFGSFSPWQSTCSHLHNKIDRERGSKEVTVSKAFSRAYLPGCHFSSRYNFVYFLQMQAENVQTQKYWINRIVWRVYTVVKNIFTI